MSEQGAARKLLQAMSARFDRILTDSLARYDAIEELSPSGQGGRSATVECLRIMREVFYDTIKTADELDIQASDATLNSVKCETHRHYGYFCGTNDES